MNSSTRISPVVAGLRLVVSMACLTRSCDRPDIDPSPRPGRYSIEIPAPSFVDADRMQAVQIAPQPLKMIAGRRSQMAVGGRVVDHLDLAEQPIFQIGRDFLRPEVVDEELPQPVIPEAQNHAAIPDELVYHTMTLFANIAHSAGRANHPRDFRTQRSKSAASRGPILLCMGLFSRFFVQACRGWNSSLRSQ